MKRIIGIIGHAAIVATLLAWSIWAGFTFWYGLFGSAWAAIGALLALDAVALWGFVMHVLRIPSPFASLRHALPLLSALPLLHSLHALAVQQAHRDAAHTGDVASWTAALALTTLLALFSWLAWRGLERLLIDPQAVALAEVEDRARRAEVAVQRISSEAQAAVRIIAAMREAVAAHEKLLSPSAGGDLVLARPADDAAQVSVETWTPPAPRYVCPRCGRELTLGQYGSAVRRGYCSGCKEQG
ncbi:MAG: hypothetical protein RMJ55_12505 [Roseiflexaceae bacterium]|nr:hypothetical protein [Roseiflexaceae bacterium]MDW8392420.1 hypothetical protein [Oscillochloridaceae bacterium]